MTPTGFMTEAAWIEITPHQIRGIRQLPFIKANPQWWVLEIFDGFGPHTSSIKAMELRAEANILSLKEEGDSSHVNQAYDQFVAKEDKATGRTTLSALRKLVSVTKGVLDQWQLVHVGLSMVFASKSGTWQASFNRVNLNPKTRVSFGEWCAKIAHFLQGGLTFKPESADDVYALLPSFWHGMQPSEKTAVVATVDFHNGFSIACVTQLFYESHILMKDMHHVRVCYDLAKEHPSHLEMEEPVPTATLVAPEVAAAAALLAPVTAGLVTFELKPKGLVGTALFEHMVMFTKRRTEGTRLAPSACLDVEMAAVQQTILDPLPQDLTCRELMKDAGGDGATTKLAKRKLDSVGYIKAHCGVANTPERIAKLYAAAQLADSIAEIGRAEKDERARQKITACGELHTLAPTAAKKLRAT